MVFHRVLILLATLCAGALLVAASAEVHAHKNHSTNDPRALVDNALEYFRNRPNEDFVCGFDAWNNTDPTIQALANKFKSAVGNTKLEFCELTFNQALPALCKLRAFCIKDEWEMDVVFAAYYGVQQITRRHQSSFTCKDQQGKEQLGQIINPDAYVIGFKDMQKILVKPLPCKNSSDDGEIGNELIEGFEPLVQRDSHIDNSTLEPRNLYYNILLYGAQKPDRRVWCGIPFKDSPNPIIKGLYQKWRLAVMSNQTDLCELTFHQALPALCKFRTFCTKDKWETDVLFAWYYAAQQIHRNNTSWFSCKNCEGKERLGQIINSDAYNENFTDMQKVLTKPLPC